MNCLCRLFDDSTLWLIIIAAILFSICCNNNSCYDNGLRSGGCGCGCN